MSRLAAPLAGWAWLTLAIAGAAGLALWFGRDLALVADELSYFGRVVDSDSGGVTYPFGLEYLLAPHNGHLQVGGKLIYEGSFALFGAAYAPLRILAVAAVGASVALFFALSRTRVGTPAALAAACALLFCGAAWEALLWPFDLHTVVALAFGLGALLALERGDRRGATVACLALVGSIAMIEVGLAFVAAAGVMILARGDSLRRLWVCAPALVLYAAWWAWARQFEHAGADLGGVQEVPGALAESLVATVGSLTGLYEHGDGVLATVLDPPPAAAVVAAIAAVGLALGMWRARRDPRTWAVATALGGYWLSIAVAGRPPDSSRYVWVSATFMLLLAAQAVEPVAATRRGRIGLAAATGLVVVAALPSGLAKLGDGRDYLTGNATQDAVEFAMLELAGERGDPRYNPGFDQFASAGLDARTYLRSADRVGSLAMALDELREQDPPLRVRADQVLVFAYRARLHSAHPPASRRGCATARGMRRPLELPRGGALIGVPPGGAALRTGRFAAGPSVDYRRRQAGWSELRLPPDEAPDPWLAFAGRGVTVCPPAG